MADGKIRLDIETEYKEAVKNLNAFGKEIDKTEKKINSLTLKLALLRADRATKDASSPTIKTIKATTDALSEQEKKLQELRVEFKQNNELARQFELQNPNFTKYNELRRNPNANA